MASQHATTISSSRILGTVGIAPKEMHHGVYLASCVQNNDPLGEGRIKMYVPQVLGTAVSNWAKPLGYNPSDVPSPGMMVHAYFAGGDINQPVYVRINFASEFSNLQNQINNIGPGAWQPLTLHSGWSNIPGYLPAQARIVTPGVVQLVGHIQSGTPTDTTLIATLPSGTYSTSSAQAIAANVIQGANADTALGTVSGSVDTAGLNDGTITGSTDTDGLPNGGISGTSGTGTNTNGHTHGPGSFAVTNGQHFHNALTMAVADGHHFHTTSALLVSSFVNNNTPTLTISASGQMTITSASPNTTQLSFNATLAV